MLTFGNIYFLFTNNIGNNTIFSVVITATSVFFGLEFIGNKIIMSVRIITSVLIGLEEKKSPKTVKEEIKWSHRYTNWLQFLEIVICVKKGKVGEQPLLRYRIFYSALMYVSNRVLFKKECIAW